MRVCVLRSASGAFAVTPCWLLIVIHIVLLLFYPSAQFCIVAVTATHTHTHHLVDTQKEVLFWDTAAGDTPGVLRAAARQLHIAVGL